MRPFALALIALLAACTDTGTGGGAVVARWRLVDATTGQPRGSCEVVNPSPGAQIDVIVDTVRVVVRALEDNHEIDCPHCEFACGALEGTTSFSFEEGVYSIGVEARSCGVPVGHPPAPVVRRIRKGEVTNLSALGILIPPCERTRCEAGVPMACDAGTSGNP